MNPQTALKVEHKIPLRLQALAEPSRYKVLYGGRGGAKSWGVARELLTQGVKRPLRILCAREVQRTIADSVHRLLADQIEALGLDGFYTTLEAEIRGKNGTSIVFAGLRQQGVAQLKSFEGVDIAWCEEAQAISRRSWDVLIPTIRKEGSEIWLTFNPELDTDETYQRFVVSPPANSIVIKMGWQDNPWFPAVLEAERCALQSRDPEAYRNVWEGEPRTVVEGAIYAREVIRAIEERRIRPVPYDPLLKVHTVWDLGWNDASAIILCQRSGSEVRVVEYMEGSHKTLAEWVGLLEKREYRWGTDYLPHDGRSKNLQTGKSPEELLKTLGRKVQIVPNIDVEQGISAARLMFPRVYFAEDKSQRLVDCLKRYRRHINQTTGQPEGPEHDEYSHGSDAFRYLAVVVDKLTNDDSFFDKPFQPDSRGVV